MHKHTVIHTYINMYTAKITCMHKKLNIRAYINTHIHKHDDDVTMMMLVMSMMSNIIMMMITTATMMRVHTSRRPMGPGIG